MEYPHFKVCVRCFTFNQSKYITDALNGFVMQQTDFPFVCCIVDDASTDGEQEVIKKYVEDNFDLTEGSCHFERETDYAFITYAQHKTNINCYFTVLYLKENHYSVKKPKIPYLAEWREKCEYEALCEGDDYWIDSIKLNKQVMYFREHEDCSLVFSNARVSYDAEELCDSVNMYNHLVTKDYTGEEVLSKWTIPTASVLIRMDIYTTMPIDSRFIYGDIVLFLSAAQTGILHCENELMVCYRRNLGGVSVKKPNFLRLYDHYQALLDHFGPSYKAIVIKLQAGTLVMGFLSGHLRIESWRCFIKAATNLKLLSLFFFQFPRILKKSI